MVGARPDQLSEADEYAEVESEYLGQQIEARCYRRNARKDA